MLAAMMNQNFRSRSILTTYYIVSVGFVLRKLLLTCGRSFLLPALRLYMWKIWSEMRFKAGCSYCWRGSCNGRRELSICAPHRLRRFGDHAARDYDNSVVNAKAELYHHTSFGAGKTQLYSRHQLLQRYRSRTPYQKVVHTSSLVMAHEQ